MSLAYAMPRPLMAPAVTRAEPWRAPLPFFAATIIFLVLSLMIRMAGGLLYFLELGCAAMLVFSVLLSRGLWVFSGIAAIRLLFALAVIGVLYLGLSWLNLLPNAWTVYYDRGVFAQQSSFVLALPLLVMAFYVMFRGILEQPRNTNFFFLLCMVFPAYRAVSVGMDGVVDLHLNTFSNPLLPVYLALGHLVFVTYGGSRVWGTILGLLLALPTTFVQNVLGALCLAAISLTRRPRLILYGLVFSALAVSVFGLWYSMEIWQHSPDTGVRLWMTNDGLDALVQSHGMGVGFGKESLRNFFQISGTTQFIDMRGGITSFLVTSIHNAMVQMFFRLGLPGGLLFLGFLFACSPLGIRHEGLRNSASFTYCIVFLTLWSNPSIESQTYHVGVAMAFGYLLACRAVSPPAR